MDPTRRQLEMWYVCDQALCNFRCVYCAAASGLRYAQGRMWAGPDGPERFRRIIEWIAALPFRIRLRLQTWGEPFLSKDFLSGAAWLSRQGHVEFVELVTNGSFREKHLELLAANGEIAKFTFWITYHHPQVTAENLVRAASTARDAGVFVVVHALAFPDTLDVVRRLVALCKEAGVRTDVTAGQNFNRCYPDHGFVPLADGNAEELARLYRHPLALEALQIAAHRSAGQPCSAGHDYVFVSDRGDVFPCKCYADFLPHTCLGSALRPGFVPFLREEPYAPCGSPQPCVCKEDYFHLACVRPHLAMGPSLGYYQPEGERVVHVGEGGGRSG
jgi:MoaA/NifB/PqqE/SkfB family radical SAM enzyme